MKTNLRIYLIILLGFLAFSSCSTTDRTVTPQGVDLNKYEYASLVQATNSFGKVTDIEIEPGVYDAVESTRLQMVGERRIQDLSDAQKEKLVLVKYTATSTSEESVISISFEDYMTGKTVASYRSSNPGAWTRQKDVDRAINKLRDRLIDIWGR